MTALLILGFLIGMRHALEADHVAAVASLTTTSRSVRSSFKLGLSWGLGHTLTLFLFGVAVFWLDVVISEQMARGLEFIVGVMLVGLGADVLYRLYRDKVRYSLHRHQDGRQHIHAFKHVPHSGGKAASKYHIHTGNNLTLRALFVGLMHGMAGSAALVLLTLTQTETLAQGMWLIVWFGLGSMLGMALLSVVISIPLQRYQQSTSSRSQSMVLRLNSGVGVFTVVLGLTLILQTGSVLWG